MQHSIRCEQEIDESYDPQQRLIIFDFDDTLVKTDSQVIVTHIDGTSESLSPGQYAVYEKAPGDVLDYSSFHTLVNPRIIRHVGKKLRKTYDTFGPDSIVILTARGGDVSYIETFLSDAGFPGIEVIGLGCPPGMTATMKSSWIADRIQDDKITYVEFFDDSIDNVDAVNDLRASFPRVKIVTQTIKSR